MKYVVGIALFLGFGLPLRAQSEALSRMFEQSDFQGIVAASKQNPPTNSKDLVMVGYAYYVLNMEQKALDYLDMAAMQGYKEPDLKLYRGLCLRYLNRLDEAERELAMFLKTNPGHPEANYELGMIAYFNKDLTKAAEIFKTLATMNPPHPGALYMRGHVAHVKTQFKEALVFFYAAGQLLPPAHPFYERTWLDLASIELGLMNRPQKAAAAYLKVLPQIQDPQTHHKALRAFYSSDLEALGDSLFAVMKKRRETEGKESPFFAKEYIEVASFKDLPDTNYTLVVHRYWKTPADLTDKLYRVECATKKNGQILRVFTLEKNMALFASSPDCILMERPLDGGAIPYSRGWKEDDLSMAEIRQAISDIWLGLLEKTSMAGARNIKAHQPGSSSP